MSLKNKCKIQIAEKISFLILIDCCPFLFNIEFIINVANFSIDLQKIFKMPIFKLFAQCSKYSKI